MTQCGECGDTLRMPYTCSYCELAHCVTHRRPEDHDCLSFHAQQVEREFGEDDSQSWFEGTPSAHNHRDTRTGDSMKSGGVSSTDSWKTRIVLLLGFLVVSSLGYVVAFGVGSLPV